MFGLGLLLLLTALSTGLVADASHAASQIKLVPTDHDSVGSEQNVHQHFVVLGDGYAAGVGGPQSSALPLCYTNIICGIDYPYESNPQCARNQAAWPWLVQFAPSSPRFPQFTYIACGGSNTGNVLAQVSAIPKDADLIVFSVGANDGESFAQAIDFCFYANLQNKAADFTTTRNPTTQDSPVTDCASAFANALNYTIHSVGSTLPAILTNIKTGWPNATIVVAGYAEFYPTDKYNATACQASFLNNVPAKDKELLNIMVHNLNTIIQGVVKDAGATYFDIGHSFKGYRFCEGPTTAFQFYDPPPSPRDGGDNAASAAGYYDFWHAGAMHPNPFGHGLINQSFAALFPN